MMRFTKNRIQLLVAILFPGMAFFCCTRETNIQLPKRAPSLVLHGYIAIGDTFKVAIGRTFAIDTFVTDDLTYIENASVAVYENDVFKDSLRYNVQEKRYIAAAAVALPGKIYKIVVSAMGYETIEATTAGPAPPQRLFVKHTKNARTTMDGNPLDDIKLSINDPVEKNFYLTALHAPMGKTSFCVYTKDPAVEQSTKDLIDFEPDNCLLNTEILYSDKSFNGSVKELTVSADPNIFVPSSNATGLHKAFLKTYSINEEYFLYFRNIISLNLSVEVPSLSEPVRIKGNVKNGYGMFTIFSAITDSIP